MSTSFLLKFNNYVKPSICDFFFADFDFNKAQYSLDFDFLTRRMKSLRNIYKSTLKI